MDRFTVRNPRGRVYGLREARDGAADRQELARRAYGRDFGALLYREQDKVMEEAKSLAVPGSAYWIDGVELAPELVKFSKGNFWGGATIKEMQQAAFFLTEGWDHQMRRVPEDDKPLLLGAIIEDMFRKRPEKQVLIVEARKGSPEEKTLTALYRVLGSEPERVQLSGVSLSYTVDGINRLAQPKDLQSWTITRKAKAAEVRLPEPEEVPVWTRATGFYPEDKYDPKLGC